MTTYRCTSIKELRLELAIQHGVLCPCIGLFAQPEDLVIKNDHDFGASGPPQLCKLHVINNQYNDKWLKEEVAHWTATEWIRELEPHATHDAQDTRIVERATAMDARFEEKMREWLVGVIEDTMSFDDLDAVVEDVRIASALGVSMNAVDPNGKSLLHRAAAYGHMGLLQILVRDEYAVKVGEMDAFGRTPLWYAVSWRRTEFAQALIRSGADPSFHANFRFIAFP